MMNVALYSTKSGYSDQAISDVSHEISNGAGTLVSTGKTAATGATSEVTGKSIDSLKM